MPAALDGDAGRLDQLRPAQGQGLGALREGGQHIQLGHGSGGRLQGRQLAEDLIDEPLVEHALARQGPFAGAEDALLQGRELVGDIALGALEGLAAPIVGGHPRVMAAAELEVIAVDAVVPDLEARHPGALPLTGLDLGEHLPGILGQAPQGVQIGIETRRDDPALAQERRRVLRKAGGEAGVEKREAPDRVAQIVQARAVHPLETGVQLG